MSEKTFVLAPTVVGDYTINITSRSYADAVTAGFIPDSEAAKELFGDVVLTLSVDGPLRALFEEDDMKGELAKVLGVDVSSINETEETLFHAPDGMPDGMIERLTASDSMLREMVAEQWISNQLVGADSGL